jgi:hypothetical protein
MTKYYFETNIAALPAINYFAFYRQYKIFESGALPYFQQASRLRNELIMLLRQKDTTENLIIKLENSKVGLQDALQIEVRPLLAMACLATEETFEGKRLPILCNVSSDTELTKLAVEFYDNLDLPYYTIIGEVGLIFDKLQRQLSKAFPKLFETDLTPFISAQDALRRIDVENENSIFEELQNIQATFLQAHKPLALLGEEQNFSDAYWTETFMLADKLGMSQEYLSKNSISNFYAKLQNSNDKHKQMENKQ